MLRMTQGKVRSASFYTLPCRHAQLLLGESSRSRPPRRSRPSLSTILRGARRGLHSFRAEMSSTISCRHAFTSRHLRPVRRPGLCGHILFLSTLTESNSRMRLVIQQAPTISLGHSLPSCGTNVCGASASSDKYDSTCSPSCSGGK